MNKKDKIKHWFKSLFCAHIIKNLSIDIPAKDIKDEGYKVCVLSSRWWSAYELIPETGVKLTAKYCVKCDAV